MNLSQNIEIIKAESLLSSFLDSCSNTNIEFQGVFSRNYHNDIIELNDTIISKENSLYLWLSRDSMFHILPEGLFFKENTLRKIDSEKNNEKFKAEEERITKEKQKIKLFFNPFDKTYFNLRFELEKKLNEIAQNRTKQLVDELFDIFHITQDNQLIRKIIPLLPVASEIRGNILLWKDILKNVFYPEKVDVRIADRRNKGQIRKYMKTTIHIEKLTTAEFINLKKDIDVFAKFFYEWFLPVDLGYEFKIKDIKEKFVLGSPLTLDYNTYL